MGWLGNTQNYDLALKTVNKCQFISVFSLKFSKAKVLEDDLGGADLCENSFDSFDLWEGIFKNIKPIVFYSK